MKSLTEAPSIFAELPEKPESPLWVNRSDVDRLTKELTAKGYHVTGWLTKGALFGIQFHTPTARQPDLL